MAMASAHSSAASSVTDRWSVIVSPLQFPGDRPRGGPRPDLGAPGAELIHDPGDHDRLAALIAGDALAGDLLGRERHESHLDEPRHLQAGALGELGRHRSGAE